MVAAFRKVLLAPREQADRASVALEFFCVLLTVLATNAARIAGFLTVFRTSPVPTRRGPGAKTDSLTVVTFDLYAVLLAVFLQNQSLPGRVHAVDIVVVIPHLIQSHLCRLIIVARIG